MKIVLTMGLLFYMMFVNWYSLDEFKRGEKLKSIYDLLIFIATVLFIIAAQVLLK